MLASEVFNIDSVIVIEEDDLHSVYTQLSEMEPIIYQVSLESGSISAAVKHDGAIMVNGILPPEFIAAYDPYWDLIVFNMEKILSFKMFDEVYGHERWHQSDFMELMETMDFKQAIEAFKAPIYEIRAQLAQRQWVQRAYYEALWLSQNEPGLDK